MHGPFLFHITALSYFLFGDSDFTSRIPTAIFGVILVALPYLFKRWLGRGGALVTSFALLISPSILYHARYIRQEEFILVWTLLTVLCTWRYLSTRHTGWLLGLAAVLAFHSSDKSTSFLTTVIFLAFLVPLALLQLYNGRRKSNDIFKALGFIGLLGLVVLFASIVFVLVSQVLATALGLGAIVAQLNPLTLNIDGRTLAFVAIFLIFTGLLYFLTRFLLSRIYGNWIRFAAAVSPSFSLIIVFITTTMFMSSPALLLVLNPLWQLIAKAELVKVSLLGEMSNLLTNSSVITTMFALSMVLVAISVAIGTFWNWRRWLPIGGLFLAITTTLFTTVFTNAAGIGTGFVGQLGYWMAQQDVKRGSQPPYYYLLIVPLYEYALVIGALCAVVYIAYRAAQILAWPTTETPVDAGVDAMSVEEAVENERNLVSAQRSTTKLSFIDAPLGRALLNPAKLFPLLLTWWTVATWVIYSLAGEKMPWLSVHFALPMALLTGWFIDHLLRMPASAKRDESGRFNTRSMMLFAVAAIAVVLLSVRVLSLLGGIDLKPAEPVELIRWAVGLVIAIAGIVLVVYLMRRIEKRLVVRAIILSVFAFLSLLTIRTAIMVTYINYDYTKEFLFYAHGAPGTKVALSQLEDLSNRISGDLSLKVGYDSDVSWPMSWYMREFPNARFNGDGLPADFADQEAIMIGDVNPKRAENEQKLQEGYTKFTYMLVWWPMQDYFDLTWERISYTLTNPQARAALWDIIFNRDYTKYSQVFNKANLTADKWSPGHRFTLFIRNDVAAKVWNYRVGTVATGKALSVNPAIRPQGPTGLAFGPNGERYLIDHKSNRIIKTDANGSAIDTFGGAGSGPGKFNDPWGIAVDGDGNIYVADTFNHRIQKFDSTGNFLFSWGTPGVSTEPGNERNTTFFGPRAIVIDTLGRLLVSDTGNKRIQIFDREGNYLAQFGHPGTGNGDFNEPVGVAVDSGGNIYVADTWNQRIEVFDANYAFVRSWPVAAWQSMDPNDLQSVDHKPYLAIDQSTVFVSSPMTHQVLAYSLDGKLLEMPNVSFAADSLPTGLVVRDNHLFVTNAANGAVNEFALTGR
jgi:DNA-binding beta-propeller fold protein YncE